MQISKAMSPTAMGGRRTALNSTNEVLQSNELAHVNPYFKPKTEKRKKEFKLEKKVKSITPSVGSLAKVFKSYQDNYEALKVKKSSPVKKSMLMKRINFHLR